MSRGMKSIFRIWLNIKIQHCVKSVCSRSYSGLHFPAFRLNRERYEVWSISPYSVRIWENVDQNISDYGYFSRCATVLQITVLDLNDQVHYGAQKVLLNTESATCPD